MVRIPDAEFILLGTGCSSGIPNLHHVLRKTGCLVCQDVYNNPKSKNRRNCVSAVVRVGDRTVLIDCGKTIRDAALRHFPSLGIRQVDSIVLTHGHTDAMYGLDDLRELQLRERAPTPVFMDEKTKQDCTNAFGFLINGGNVGKAQWRIHQKFEPFQPLEDDNLTFTPVPLLHGGEYVCWGYIIKYRNDSGEKTIAYLSDLHEMPDESMQILKQHQPIDLLVIDVLIDDPTWSHFGMEQARNFARELKPQETRCVGMHCSLGLHNKVQDEFKVINAQDGLNFQLGYDGERFTL